MAGTCRFLEVSCKQFSLCQESTQTEGWLSSFADNFAHALHWQGQMDADFEGSTLTVANLVHLKHVKGYISQAHRKLVLYKTAGKIIEIAFPPLDTVDISKIGV